MKMVDTTPKRYSLAGRRLFLLTVFGICLILSLTSFLILRAWEQARFEFEFERRAGNQANLIIESFHQYRAAVQSIGNFLENSVGTSRKEFKGFTENILKNYPGMQAVSWNLRIKDNQRRIYEESNRKEGFKGFQFTQRNSNGDLVRAKERSEYVVVYYIEPLKGNEAALGFDIASNPKRLETIEQARDTGNIVITEKITLVQEQEHHAGVLMLFPMYKYGGSLNTPAERQVYLEGFSVGVLRIGQIIEKKLFKDSLEWMVLYLYDESAEKGNQLLYYTADGNMAIPLEKHQVEARFHWAARFEVGGRQWKLVLLPSSVYGRLRQSLQPWVVLTGMLVFSFFLLFYLQKNFRYTKILEREISERQRAEQDLQLYKGKLEDTVRQRTHDLGERVKELNCLYGISHLVTKKNNLPEDIFQGTVNLIPQSWQYPEITCARILFDEHLFKTEDLQATVYDFKTDLFQETIWMQKEDIYADLKVVGTLAVYYMEERRHGDAGLFLKEEKVLLNTIADELGRIIERFRSEEKLKLAKIAAESANRAKSEFLANMSHEIRTPMNAVIGFSEILNNLVVDKKQKSYLDSIQTAGKSLLTLINDILDLSKIEAGKLELNFEPVNIQVILNEIRQVFSLKTKKKNLDFQIDINPDIPSFLVLDEIRVRQILLNLVGNSVKFSDTGGIIISVKQIGQHPDKSKLDLVIAIKDTGIGIPEDQINIIFESFRQQEGQSNRKYGGTGLGLTITKRLLEMMDGDISVESQVGIGTTFYIRLHNVAVSTVKSLKAIPEKQFQLRNIIFDKGLILVVDDTASNRDLITELLSQAGLETLQAKEGQVAVISAEENQPDLIFMDIRMPIMDGYQSVLQIKRNPKTRHIPVIALTASVKEEEKINLKDSGFSGFLSKPVDAELLFSEVSKYINYQKKDVKPIPAEDFQPDSSPLDNGQNIKELPMLLDTLKNETLPIWEGLKGALDMEEIQHFAINLSVLAEKHKAIGLQVFLQNISDSIDYFDVEAIERALNSFPEEISRLERIGKN